MIRSFFRSRWLWLSIVMIIGLLALRYYSTPSYETKTELLMDTRWRITVPASHHNHQALADTFKAVEKVGIKFDHRNPKSQVYRFNHTGEPITDPDIIRVIKRAVEVSKLTHGGFDITVEPLIEAFGFYTLQFEVPSENTIKELLHHVGYQKLVVTDTSVSKADPKLAIDLGGIAKGVALESARRVLLAHGVKSALIDGGGDIYALGTDYGKPWHIGIEHPRDNTKVIGSLDLQDAMVFSSGDYERYFFVGKTRYHHIFNPHTGYPARGVISSTVIFPDPFLSAGLSSSLFVLGPVEGLKFIDSIPNASALIVDESMGLHYSSRMKPNQEKLK